MVDWIQKLELGSKVFDSTTRMCDCIVKVSCLAVHGTLIPQAAAWEALQRIDRYGTDALKTELSKVLTACIFISRRCLVIVMKDLSRLNEQELAVSESGNEKPRTKTPFDGFATQVLRWDAFSLLATNLLEPMARIGVIHVDVRCDPASKRICNVLVYDETKLALIDYDSLVCCTDSAALATAQATAIPFLEDMCTGATYVLWQIMWVAFVSTSSNEAAEGTDNMVDAKYFVQNLLTNDEKLDHFTQRIGVGGMVELSKGLEALSRPHEAVEAAAVIGRALKIFRDMFARQSQHEH